jgi:hypothetical protein
MPIRVVHFSWHTGVEADLRHLPASAAANGLGESYHIVVWRLVAERLTRLMEEVLPVHERDGPVGARFSYHGGRKK